MQNREYENCVKMGMLGKRSFARTKSKAIINSMREVKQSFQCCNNGQGNRPMNFQ